MWLDVLGFARLLRGVEAGHSAAHYRLSLYEEVIEEIISPKWIGYYHFSKLFSDTLVIVIPYPTRSYRRRQLRYQLPFIVARIQRRFLRSGFLARGVAESGRVVITKLLQTGTIYRPLNEIEGGMAVVPRVVFGFGEDGGVSDDHFAEAEDFGNAYREAETGVAFDKDGLAFVDYFLEPVQAGEEEFILAHKEFIEVGATALDSRVRAKYAWMAEYHNWVIESSGFCSHWGGRRLSVGDRQAMRVQVPANDELENPIQGEALLPGLAFESYVWNSSHPSETCEWCEWFDLDQQANKAG